MLAIGFATMLKVHLPEMDGERPASEPASSERKKKK